MKRKKNQKAILLSDPAERRTAAELSAYLLAQSMLALVMLHLFQRAIDALKAKEETLLCYPSAGTAGLPCVSWLFLYKGTAEKGAVLSDFKKAAREGGAVFKAPCIAHGCGDR